MTMDDIPQSPAYSVPAAKAPKKQPAAARGSGNRRTASARPNLPPDVRANLPDSDLAKQLNGMVGLILKADEKAKDAAEAQALMKDLVSAVGELPDEAFRILAGNDEVQRIFQRIARQSEARPGDPIWDINGRQVGMVPFTYEDFCEIYPMMTWMPVRTNNCISVNGVAIAVYEGVEVTTPKVFYDIEMESLAYMRGINPDRLLQEATRGASDGVTSGQGWMKESPEELIRKYGVER